MRLLLTLIGLSLLSSPICAQDLADVGSIGEIVTVTLSNGDVVTGTLVESRGAELILEHPLLGRLTIPRTVIVVPEPEPAALDDLPVETPWAGTADISMTGNSGNTSNTTIHAEMKLRRETDETVDSILLTADRRTESTPGSPGGRKDTDRRRYGRFRREWKLEESRWRPFFEASTDHDFQRDYNELVTLAGGAGYLISESEDETLLGRIGAAESKRVGAPRASDAHWTLEVLAGLDYRLDITPRQHLAAETTLFPSAREPGEFRTVSKAEWRLDLSEEAPWYYKVGATHDYDSQVSSPTRRADLSYYMGVGTVF